MRGDAPAPAQRRHPLRGDPGRIEGGGIDPAMDHLDPLGRRAIAGRRSSRRYSASWRSPRRRAPSRCCRGASAHWSRCRRRDRWSRTARRAAARRSARSRPGRGCGRGSGPRPPVRRCRRCRGHWPGCAIGFLVAAGNGCTSPPAASISAARRPGSASTRLRPPARTTAPAISTTLSSAPPASSCGMICSMVGRSFGTRVSEGVRPLASSYEAELHRLRTRGV